MVHVHVRETKFARKFVINKLHKFSQEGHQRSTYTVSLAIQNQMLVMALMMIMVTMKATSGDGDDGSDDGDDHDVADDHWQW